MDCVAVRGICCMTFSSDSTSGDGRQPHFIGQAPRFVLRDRDAIYGRDFAARTRDMGMEEVLTAPRSPWQNPFVERLVALSVASVWTTLSCGRRDRRDELCTTILPAISGPERI